jgi:ATP-dependent helicase/nuclease subunit A
VSTPPIALPRELVLASAGTGKTFRISSRIIGLLAAGVPPDSIFASTFTRKAAGEILDRVLARLAAAALDSDRGAELAVHARLHPHHRLDPAPDAWLAVLARVVGELHRLNVGTIDSFFVRAATSFAAELALPPAWRIADAPEMERVRARALAEVLATGDEGVLVELVRSVTRAEAGRSVHDALLRGAEKLLELHHALDPVSAEPWHRLDRVADASPPDTAAARAALAGRLRAAELPRTGAGRPNQRWASSVESAARQVEAGEWEKVVDSTLCRAAREEGGSFSSVQVPAEICAIFRDACGIARGAVARRLARQSRALGRLAHLLAGAVAHEQAEGGAFDFGDLTRLIGGHDPLAARPDLYYRLDARTQHVLLDEFQDTSLAQWEALEPLLDELLMSGEGDRAGVVVADPKQSIYAWRGGEPRLVSHVGERYALAPEELHLSYRSSQVVLDSVNTVFRDLPENAVFANDPGGRAVAEDWAGAFVEHRAANLLPGYVSLQAGPEDEGRGSDRPLLCRRAAERVAELHRAAPERSIGVLTRRNRTVARLMMELRELGVPASGEGGNPLTDSPAVASLLALLRLAEHPGDAVSRYHVARTPVGTLRSVRLTDHRDGAAARRLSLRVRARLLEQGYGRTLEELAAGLAPHGDARDRRRLAQLAEMGYRFDARATLRVSDFIRQVESQRVEDPTAARVRVMTIHQSKGLEFDAVVLPELDAGLLGREAELLAYRPHPAGRVTHAFPYVPAAARELLADVEELSAAAEQARAGRLRDGLSGLYVALTRARHALYLLVKPDGRSGMGTALTGARLVRLALGATDPAAEGVQLFRSGDPEWFRSLERRPRPSAAAQEPVPAAIRMRTGARTRSLPRRSPSELAGGSRVELAPRLSLESRGASEGTVVHAWLERLRWVEDGLPPAAELFAIARRLVPHAGADDLSALQGRLRLWLQAPEVRRALSRDEYPSGATVECEVPILHRDGEVLLEGVVDRLVLVPGAGGAPAAAVVLDYKTDALAPEADALDARARHYRPQMEAYRRAVAASIGLKDSAVECRLIFLSAGAVRRL